MTPAPPAASRVKHRSLYVKIVTAFASLLLVALLAVVIVNYQSNKRILLALSHELMARAADRVMGKTEAFLTPASQAVQEGAHFAQTGVFRLEDRAAFEQFAIEKLHENPQVSMFYFGDEQGNFIMLRRQPDGTFATQIVDRRTGLPIVTWTYHNDAGQVTRVETNPKDSYDPRTRPWYRGALEGDRLFWTDVYVFYTGHRPGITAAQLARDADGRTRGVFGVDIELCELSQFLQTQRIGRSGYAVIVDANNELVAFPNETCLVKRDGDTWRMARADELDKPSLVAALHEPTRAQGITTITVDGERFVVATCPFPASFRQDWKVIVIVPEEDTVGAVREAHRRSLLVGVAILAVALILVSRLSYNISHPIRMLAAETARIQDFQLDETPPIATKIAEIHLMSEALARTKSGLAAFRKYVPAELVRQLIRSGEEARVGGHNRVLTVFFSDVANFTSVSEQLPPEALMQQLSEYLDALTRILMEERATVDKYIGDAVMAFWGAPIPDADHAVHACAGALRCREKVAELNERWQRSGRPVFPTRIGLHTGEVIVGNLGSSERLNYTVIGDTVNLANRLEGANKFFGTEILVSRTTRELVGEQFIFRPLGAIAVKNKVQGIDVYEILARPTDFHSAAARKLTDGFAVALVACRQRNFGGALASLESLQREFPTDAPTRLFVERCRARLRQPPPPDWDGIERLDEK